MILDAKVHDEGLAKLTSLGLDVPTIHDVLLRGQAESATYTDFDPTGTGEIARWARQVRHLSEVLVPQGWARVNPDHQPTIVHPSQKHCVVVASGDAFTGTRFGSPTTKNPRGRSFRDAVSSNAVLMNLHDIEPALEGLKETWVLLTFASSDGRLCSEVSLPSNMTGSYISAWKYRILIPSIDPQNSFAEDGEEEVPSYDFKVARK